MTIEIARKIDALFVEIIECINKTPGDAEGPTDVDWAKEIAQQGRDILAPLLAVESRDAAVVPLASHRFACRRCGMLADRSHMESRAIPGLCIWCAVQDQDEYDRQVKTVDAAAGRANDKLIGETIAAWSPKEGR